MSMSEIDPKQPVSMGDFQQVLKTLQDEFNDALKKRDEHIEARFNQFAGVLQQVVDKLQAGPQAAATAGIDKNEIVQKAIDKLADRYLNNQPESELDSMSRVAVEIAKREAVGALKLQIRRGVRKGLIFETEVEEMIGHKLEEKILPGAAHGPV